MTEVDVRIGPGAARDYRIVIGPALPVGVADDLAAFTAEEGRGRAARWAVLSDEIVAPLYGHALARALGARGIADCLAFPAGEAAKVRDTVTRLQDRLIGSGHGRDTWIVAVGGGVVGDVAGFVAATLFRGVPYVQVPTTLLAMVDSSVGGKVGVDTPAGKNLVGAFWQPRRVLVDVTALDSLPPEEMSAGMAEVIKYGVILDAGLLEDLEAGDLEACLAHDRAVLERTVARCCELKASVVAADERESDYRQILNFGHTVGHAVELERGYGLRHGEAVAIGMVVEARLARRLVGAPADLAGRIAGLARRAGLPTGVPAGCDAAGLLEAMRRDKKVRGGEVRCALPREAGRMHRGPQGHGIAVEPGLLEEVLLEEAREDGTG